MSWEQRGNNRYYYHAKRVGNKVVKQYFGRGTLAELAATQYERHRQAVMERKTDLAQLRALEQAVSEYHDTCTHYFSTILYLNGYHYHRGSWRRRRNVDTTSAE